MKAAWYRRQGPADEVLELGELSTPHPAPGEVLVALAASGVNPADCNRRRGAGYAMEAPLVVPHSDGAGTVVAVGDGVDARWRGRRVWLYNGQRGGRTMGTAAGFIAVSVDLVAELPAPVSFEHGACLGIPCMTAYACTLADGPIPGQTVLVTGGAGAVGHYAIQLAKWGGARVVTTVSSDAKAIHARAAGADVVIDYRREPVADAVLAATAGAGVQRIVDVDFGGNLDASLAVLQANGQLFAYASRGNPTPAVPFHDLMRKCIAVRPILLNALPPPRLRAIQDGVGRWLREAAPVHTLAAVLPLERCVDAHRLVESGTKLGTVVVTPG